jgi:UDP-N-acetylglucosamine acyltransferase
MAAIHSSAIVAAGAKLGEGVEIGPFCVIGAHVELGANVKLHSHVVVEGHTRVGARCSIFPFASIGHQPQDLKFKGEPSRLEIGDDTIIREHVTMNPGTAGGGMLTKVGNRCLIMVGSHVAHDCRLGDNVIMANNATLGGHVELGDWVTVGGLVGIHQFVKVGAHAMLGFQTAVSQDVPPFMLVDGNPAETRTVNKIGLERHGVPDATITALRQAYKVLFREGLTVSNALTRIEAELPALPEINHLVEFCRSSERGISK